MFPRRSVLLTGFVLASCTLAGCGSSSSSSNPTSTPAAAPGPAKSANTASLGLMSPGTLTVGTDPTYPPMESGDINNPGTFVGADVDLAQALAMQMGLKGAHMVKGSFDTLLVAMDAKRYDVVMSSMNDTPARAKTHAFVDYMTASEGILVKKGSPIHADNYSALCGKTVTVQRGTTELDGLTQANKTCKSKITILPFTGDTDAYQAFAVGHSDAYTSDLPVIANYIKLHPGVYRQAGKAITAGEKYGIALRMGDTALKAALTKALAAIRANGKYAAILKKWGVGGASLR